MDVDLLGEFLGQPRQSEDWLSAIGVRNQRAAHTALARIVQSGLTLDLAALMCQQLEQILPATDNADQAIANLERFVSASRNPLAAQCSSAGETITAINVPCTSRGGSEPLYVVELTAVNQANATQALLRYMAGAMVEDLIRLVPPGA